MISVVSTFWVFFICFDIWGILAFERVGIWAFRHFAVLKINSIVNP